jgi:regulator of protease activity HflC (stomatin/prohibitin superfamily)
MIPTAIGKLWEVKSIMNNWSGNPETGPDRPFRHFRHKLSALVVLLVIALTSLGVIGSDLYSVGVSQVGILVNPYTGDFSGPIAGPTLAWKSVPWVNVVIISTAVQTIQMVGPGSNINVLTRDNLNVSLDVTLRYQVMASNVIALYKRYPGLSWEDNTLVPLVRSSVRDVVANYTADELQAVRAQIQAGVEAKLTMSLATEPSLADDIQLVEINVRDIVLPNSFLAAIQAKLNAQQQLLQAQFSAQQLIVTALGQRNATIIAAQAQANATLIQASANAQSISDIISQVETQTKTTWNSTQVAAFTNMYTELQLLSKLAGQNLYIFVGSPNGSLIIPTRTGP